MNARLRTNEVYKAIVAELEAIGATYTIEPGSKHFMIRYEKDGVKGQTTVAGSTGDWRAPLNAKRDIRKNLRECGLIKNKTHDAFDTDDVQQPAPTPQPVRVVAKAAEKVMPETAAPTVIGQETLVEIDGEPRMRDLDIGSALGYNPVINVRALIRANFDELRRYGHIAEEAVPTGSAGGRPSVNYMLNREQALLVAVLSRTNRAANVRQQVIQAYVAWEDAHRVQPAPVVIEKAPEPEVLMNEQAIEALVQRLSSILPTERATETVREIVRQGSSQEFVGRKQFEEVMSQMVAWQRQRFDRIDRVLAEPAITQDEVDARITARMKDLNRELLVDVRASIAESMDVLSRSIQALSAVSAAPAQAPVAETEPAMEPVVDEFRDFVSVGDIYGMAGLNTKKVPALRRLSRIMGYSLEEFAAQNRSKTYKYTDGNGQMRRQWTRDLVTDWYRARGRQMIIDHVEEQEFNRDA